MKKGFTLIELLAVIVILAIIALIATPIILNIVNDTRVESDKRSIDNIIHTAVLYYSKTTKVQGNIYKEVVENVGYPPAQSNLGSQDVEQIRDCMYENWDEPDLIVIFRGTNDAYFALNEPNVFKTNQTLEEAVEQICQYFRSLHPKAKIVWATPIYRADVPQKDLDQVRSTLYKICPQYQVGVFDLHMMGAFGKLNYDNNWQLLYDGIHLHDIGAAEMITCYQEYLRELDQ